MNANTLKDLVMSKMTTEPVPTTASDANGRFGAAVQEHLEDTCEITYSWAATNGSGSPDPVVLFTAKPVFSSFTLLPVANITLWGTQLYTLVLAGAIVPDDSSFVVDPLTFGPIPFVITQSGATDADSAQLHVCSEIINGISNMISLVPATGVHGAYTGSGLMATIE